MPTIETLLLANHAESLNGLLYVSGGGWTEHWRGSHPESQPPPISHVGIALTILVGWTETNRRYPLSVKIESEDGTEVVRVEGEMESGRPPGAAQGADLRSVLAVNTEITFPHGGGYRVVAQVANDIRSVSFRVHDSFPPGQLPPG